MNAPQTATLPVRVDGGERLTLSDLADQIIAEHDALVAEITSAAERARHIGEMLLQAKRQLKHGLWLPWLQLKCPGIGKRTAQTCMKIAKFFAERPEQAAELGLLTYRGVLEAMTPKSAAAAHLDPADVPTSFTVTPEPVGKLTPESVGPLQSCRVGPLQARPTGPLQPTERIVCGNAAIIGEPEITVDEALKILRRIKNCQSLARFRIQQRIVHRLKLELKKAEAQLGKAEKVVIETAKAERAKQAAS